MSLAASELILNPDGTIYHLNLAPGDIASTIITVGDPDRVTSITRHFDSIEVAVQKREFKTQTGMYRGKKLTVISTGIGTDNIDIVFNELDALVNIDFDRRKVKEQHTPLQFIRIGTSGAIQKDIPVDSWLVSEKAIGFDNLIWFYAGKALLEEDFAEAFMTHMQWSEQKASPYVVAADVSLQKLFQQDSFTHGVTATNVGFYGPQGRRLRLALEDAEMNQKLGAFEFQQQRITNLEMETSGIYAMSKLLGHSAISLNAILANRATGAFSNHPEKTIDRLIIHTLETLVS
ncbi:nucleoside phosphorylase [Altibacter sp. HG106]|uniref:nucleoside phosphorylase n=1 Tax=Altibacter sp. HG106 TaxID=3023937 RepID=UPI002350D894|nr:nucleoside phosphorylase [Altibacter sp. HG106]MDC7993510.1 nucleoside phosphorylase [Altibacter sp. HG106]